MIMMTTVSLAHASSHQMWDVRSLRHMRKIVVKILNGVSTKFVILISKVVGMLTVILEELPLRSEG